MGTLAKDLAEHGIKTPAEHYWAEAEGFIEDVDGVLKITTISVTYHLKVPAKKISGVEKALLSYLPGCPAAQSVTGCIIIRDDAVIEPLD